MSGDRRKRKKSRSRTLKISNLCICVIEKDADASTLVIERISSICNIEATILLGPNATPPSASPVFDVN